MIAVSVQIQGLKELQANFRSAPTLTLKYLAKATQASLAEIDAQVTEGGIMQFKTPRNQRTGMLVATWGLRRRISAGGLQGETGPTRNYAPYVYFGARGRKANKYMDRIAKKAQPGVQKHFQDAVDIIAKKTSQI